MNRIVLALLALFAGLAAPATPAAARMAGSGDTEIGSIDAARGTRPAAAQTVQVDAPAARQERRARDNARVRQVRAVVFIPTVLFGADRAFE